MKIFTKTAIAAAGIGMATMAFAADPLHNTTWQTYDEGQPKGVVKITESNGVLTGKVDRWLYSKSQAVCRQDSH